MKNKRTKNILALTALFSLVGCNATKKSENKASESATEEAYKEKEIACASYSVSFRQNETKDSIYPYFSLKGQDSSFYSDTPITLSVRSKSSGIIETFSEALYTKGYDFIKEEKDGYSLTSEIKTDNGSVFSIKDTYQNRSDLITINREIEILEADTKDAGFASIIKFKDRSPVSHDKYDYFMPSIIYKDTEDMVNGAIFSNTDLTGRIYVKETRTGLPMMYLRNQMTNVSFSLSHIANNMLMPTVNFYYQWLRNLTISAFFVRFYFFL